MAIVTKKCYYILKYSTKFILFYFHSRTNSPTESLMGRTVSIDVPSRTFKKPNVGQDTDNIFSLPAPRPSNSSYSSSLRIQATSLLNET